MVKNPFLFGSNETSGVFKTGALGHGDGYCWIRINSDAKSSGALGADITNRGRDFKVGVHHRSN
jgi:hypothetical protein